tara:strand:+ start:690 stop:980 length:291 start_codon:yes stop_codon:yes gene_type:complete
MTRTQIINDADGSREVLMTPEEEAIRDADLEVWAADAPFKEMRQIRELRDRLLTETDWAALEGNTMSSDMKTYRQALRDIPASNTVFADVTWPTKP